MSLFLILQYNEVVATEYYKHTSNKYGIEFEFPISWSLTEKTTESNSQHEVVPEILIQSSSGEEISIDKYYDPTWKFKSTEDFTEVVFQNLISPSFEQQYTRNAKIIEEPKYLTIDNEKIGSFEFVMHEDTSERAVQSWSVNLGDTQYHIVFLGEPDRGDTTNINSFNNAENTEIRNHFINSLKFIDSNTNTKLETVSKGNSKGQLLDCADNYVNPLPRIYKEDETYKAAAVIACAYGFYNYNLNVGDIKNVDPFTRNEIALEAAQCSLEPSCNKKLKKIIEGKIPLTP
ncbi:MAG: hypothetical protein ACE5SW_11000 [Nitrososphaeraceae archaeon]